MSGSVLQRISNGVLMSDGAMGTELQAAGLSSGECGDHWNITQPQKVAGIHRSYFEAGSDVLITNTFGACSLMLKRHGLAEEVAAINEAGVSLAREAGTDETLVLGDIGPFCGIMAPLGDVAIQDVRDSLKEQVEVLVASGVDGIIVETQTALEEATIGVEAALQAGAPCVIVSFSYDVKHDGSDVATMMGIAPEEAAAFATSSGAHILGVNCGTSIDADWAARITKRYRKSCDLPVMAQPNAGQPVLEGAKVVYRETPQEMAARIPTLLNAGVSIVGACCGSTPDHIEAIHRAVRLA